MVVDVWHVSTSCLLEVGYMLNLNQLLVYQFKVETCYYYDVWITRARVGTSSYLAVDTSTTSTGQSYDLLSHCYSLYY